MNQGDDLTLRELWRRMWRGLLNDWRWKLASLLLGCMLFFLIRGSIRHTKVIRVPIAIDPHAAIAATTIDPLSVELTVQGTVGELQQFDGKGLHFVVRPTYKPNGARSDFGVRWWLRSILGRDSEVSGNEEVFRLSMRQLQGSRGKLKVIKIEPKQAKAIYDVRSEAEVPVAEPVVTGRPYRGRVEVVYKPKKVKVIGSQDQIRAMVESGLQLQTESVDVDGRVQSFTKILPVLQPSMSRLLKFDPPEIEAEVRIITDRFTREFMAVPVLLAGETVSCPPMVATPPTVDIRLSGRVEAVNALATNQVSALVDLRDCKAGVASNALPVKLVLPFDLTVELVEIVPAEVFVAPVSTTNRAGATDGE